MKRIAPRPPLLALFLASTLTGAASVADPLHKYGDAGAWCHVESGWIFPKDVGDFARVLQPYNIDGNDDAGAEYKQESGPQQSAVEVDVYAVDSAAAAADIDGARASAALAAGEGAKVESEQPFPIDAVKGLNGVKIKYATGVNLYYFTTDRWRVKVLARVKQAGNESDRALDTFVQALPWNTLGTNPGIH